MPQPMFYVPIPPFHQEGHICCLTITACYVTLFPQKPSVPLPYLVWLRQECNWGNARTPELRPVFHVPRLLKEWGPERTLPSAPHVWLHAGPVPSLRHSWWAALSRRPGLPRDRRSHQDRHLQRAVHALVQGLGRRGWDIYVYIYGGCYTSGTKIWILFSSARVNIVFTTRK